MEKEKLRKGRKNPSKNTLLRLWLAAGGRCQFEGCNDYLLKDDITWKTFNGANVAHIVAASSDGPRGNDMSSALSDQLSNLMLLCPKHHKEVDTFVDDYPVERLLKMKRLQEQKVQQLLDEMNYLDVEIMILESPIKGITDIRVDHEKAVAALRSNAQNPASPYPLLVRIDAPGQYSSPDYWKALTEKLDSALQRELHARLQYDPSMRLALFPMAPIPLIIKLGELLGDKRPIEIFQKTRMPDTWIWQSDEATNSFHTEIVKRPEGSSDCVALIISLTAVIAEERVTEVYNASTIYHLQASKNGVDCISSLEDLSLFWHEYQRICDEIKNVNHIDEIALFLAVPISAAFEIGRRHMPGVHPILNIYDDNNGFFEALKIGG